MLLNRRFIKLFSVTLDQRDRILWTMTEANTNSIAQDVADQLRFSIDYLQCTFSATDYAIAATVAKVFVNLNDGTFRHESVLKSSSFLMIPMLYTGRANDYYHPG